MVLNQLSMAKFSLTAIVRVRTNRNKPKSFPDIEFRLNSELKGDVFAEFDNGTKRVGVAEPENTCLSRRLFGLKQRCASFAPHSYYLLCIGNNKRVRNFT